VPSPLIGVCIVIYRTEPDLLRACIESVRRTAAIDQQKVRILVVDNSEVDDLARAFAESTDDWLTMSENSGFGRACNSGLARMRERWSPEEVLFLNPDAELSEGSLLAFKQAASDASNSVLLCGWLSQGGRVQTDAFMHWWFSTERIIRRLGYRRYLESHKAAGPVRVQKVSGGALWGSVENLDRLGPFDERFFLYGEDVDLSIRARAAGFDLYAVPGASINHRAASSQKSFSAIVETARIDAAIRVVLYHKGYLASCLARFELFAVTLIGLIPGLGRSSGSSRSRTYRFGELRRWMLYRDRATFTPRETS
jgi:N-acetylglucosaminyl-diphospho-decaprenol L-rhamnosyltransferase